MMSMIRSESFEKSVELSVEEARKQYSILKQRAKDKLESVRWPKSDGEVKSPSHSIPDLTVSDSIEHRAIKSPSRLSLDTDDSDLDGAPASAMPSDDPSNLHAVASELSSMEPIPATEITSANTEIDDTPLGYRSLVKAPTLERSVEEARKQYMILKQKAKDKLDSIRSSKPSDDNKPMSPIHAPPEHPNFFSSSGTYMSQSDKILESNKGVEGLDMDDSDPDTDRRYDVTTKYGNGKNQSPDGKGGQFNQAQRNKHHFHGPRVSATRGETANKAKAHYVQALSRTDPDLGRYEREKTLLEIVKLGEEIQYYKGRQRLLEDEKEIFKLKREKSRIEIEILEKRLLGHIKQFRL